MKATELLALLTEFYQDKMVMRQRHVAAARLISNYEFNNTYQYVIAREDLQLNWLRDAVTSMGAVPPDVPEPAIALKGKAIPSRSPLVEALFLTELETGVLAAGHDLAAMELPVMVDIASGDERSIRYDGAEESLKAGDQYMRDAGGHILTSIIQGPTTHARLTDQTVAAIYCLYGPPGVSRKTMETAVEATARLITLCAPDAVERGRVVLSAP